MWPNFKKWVAQPFSADMSAANWFMFIGLLALASLGWRLILSRITTQA